MSDKQSLENCVEKSWWDKTKEGLKLTGLGLATYGALALATGCASKHTAPMENLNPTQISSEMSERISVNEMNATEYTIGSRENKSLSEEDKDLIRKLDLGDFPEKNMKVTYIDENNNATSYSIANTPFPDKQNLENTQALLDLIGEWDKASVFKPGNSLNGDIGAIINFSNGNGTQDYGVLAEEIDNLNNNVTKTSIVYGEHPGVATYQKAEKDRTTLADLGTKTVNFAAHGGIVGGTGTAVAAGMVFGLANHAAGEARQALEDMAENPFEGAEKYNVKAVPIEEGYEDYSEELQKSRQAQGILEYAMKEAGGSPYEQGVLVTKHDNGTTVMLYNTDKEVAFQRNEDSLEFMATVQKPNNYWAEAGKDFLQNLFAAGLVKGIWHAYTYDDDHTDTEIKYKEKEPDEPSEGGGIGGGEIGGGEIGSNTGGGGGGSQPAATPSIGGGEVGGGEIYTTG